MNSHFDILSLAPNDLCYWKSLCVTFSFIHSFGHVERNRTQTIMLHLYQISFDTQFPYET